MPSAYTPLPNPPPPGSPWEPIEAARKKLGWSASELSRRAVGEKSRGHYTLLATRNTWNADLETVEAFVRALKEAGIPEADLRVRPRAPHATETIRDEAVELLVRRGYRLRTAEQYVQWLEHEPPRGPGQKPVTAKRLATLAGALIDADGEFGEELAGELADELERKPGPKDPPPSIGPVGPSTRHKIRGSAGRR